MEFLQYATMNGNKNRRVGGGGSFVSGSEEFAAPVKQRSQANARERDRTHSVNTAFSTLRTLIPTEPKDRKLSKIETLRLASSYISHLGTQLIAGPVDQPCLLISTNPTDGADRPQVCTFCIAHKKTPKNTPPDNYDCSQFDSQLFPITTDLNTIYYQ